MKRFFFYGGLALIVLIRLSGWRANRERATALCHSLSGPIASHVYFSAIPKELPQGGWILEDVISHRGALSENFPGKGFVEESLVRPFSGQRVQIQGPFRCLVSPRNPASTDQSNWRPEPLAIGAFGRRFSVQRAPELNSVVFYQSFLVWLGSLSHGFPGVHAWLRSVWVGDATRLPPEWQRFYRESGLQPLIALSGQHVVAFVLVLQVLLRMIAALFFPWLPTGWYCQGQRCLPLLCSLILLVTSGGAESIRRTAAMAGAFFLLRLRCKESGVLQLAGSSVACLILWDPALLTSVSFLLSASATLMTCRLLAGGAVSAWRDYVWSATVLPVTVLPLTAFLFSKLALTAPLHSLVLSWLWDLLLIPLGFLLLIILSILPAAPRQIVLDAAERFWGVIERVHDLVRACLPTYQVSSIRPTWTELILCEGLLMLLALGLRDRRSVRHDADLSSLHPKGIPERIYRDSLTDNNGVP
jgi:hypothetical protein